MSAYTPPNVRGGPTPWPLPPTFAPGLAKAEKIYESNSQRTSEKELERETVEQKETVANKVQQLEAVSQQKSEPFEDAVDYLVEPNLKNSHGSSNKAALDLGIEVDAYVDDELDAEVPTTKNVGTLFSSDKGGQREFNLAQGASEHEQLDEHGPISVPDIYDIEISSSNESIHSSPEVAPKPVISPKRVLRRPIASRRKNLIGLDIVTKDSNGEIEDHQKPHLSLPSSANLEVDKNNACGKNVQIAAEKGILMRPDIPRMHLVGINRAETGLIMSKEDLKSTRNRDLPANPAPKSFRPFFGEDDELPSLSPASFRDKADQVDASPKANLFEGNTRSRQHSSVGFSFSTIQPTVRSQPTYGYSRDEENSYSKFVEPRASLGLMGRLTSGLHRASTLMGRRSFSVIPETEATDIMIPGTLDEAVCRICVVCRNVLDYRVFVRDSGRKIKVESIEESDNEFLRVSLRVKELPGSEMVCSINVRQCKSDQMKTGFAAMWRFYQRLEQELRPMPRPHENIFSDPSPR